MFYGCLGAGEVFFFLCVRYCSGKKKWIICICEFKFFWPEVQRFVGFDFSLGKKRKQSVLRTRPSNQNMFVFV